MCIMQKMFIPLNEMNIYINLQGAYPLPRWLKRSRLILMMQGFIQVDLYIPIQNFILFHY